MYRGLVRTRDGAVWYSSPKDTKDEAITDALFQIKILRRKRKGNPRPEFLTSGAWVEDDKGDKERILF